MALFGRVFERLRNVGLDRTLRRKVEAALRPDPGFSQTQMALWEATTSSDRHRAAEAWRDLAERCRSHGNRRQAALCYRRLAADFGGVRFDDGLGPADLIAMMKDDRPLSREIEEVGSDPWPAALPEAITDPDSGSSVQFFHLPVEIVPGSVCERLDVALDHQAETLRFQGNGHSTYWDVALPSDNPRFRGGFPLHRAWGVGPLIIAQVGTDLFGIVPLDAAGEPAPALLWHRDLLATSSDGGSDLEVRFVPGAGARRRAHFDDRSARPARRPRRTGRARLRLLPGPRQPHRALILFPGSCYRARPTSRPPI